MSVRAGSTLMTSAATATTTTAYTRVAVQCGHLKFMVLVDRAWLASCSGFASWRDEPAEFMWRCAVEPPGQFRESLEDTPTCRLPRAPMMDSFSTRVALRTSFGR